MRTIKQLTVVVIVATLAAGGDRAWASEDQEPPVEKSAGDSSRAAATTNGLEKARAAFEQGQIHYSMGEYDHAIAKFREAYELSAAPALLFNIAQAYRLKGSCPQALEIFRHFVRLAPDSAHASEADVQIKALQSRCATDLSRPVSTTPKGDAPLKSSLLPVGAPTQVTMTTRYWPARVRAATILLVAGGAGAAGAGLLYWWNDARYARWSQENQLLATKPGPEIPPSVWVARQNGNDERLRSIHRVDIAVGVIGALSAACVVTSATLGILPGKGALLALTPGEIHLAWRF